MQRKPKRGFALLGFYCISGQSLPEDTTGQPITLISVLSRLSEWSLGCLGLDQWCSFKVRTTTPLTGNVAPAYGLQGSTELLSQDIARHSPPRDALSCLG